jgi:hypothetical protein
MPSKITLSLKPEVIAKAKRIATEKHTSVSALFTQMVLANPPKKRKKIKLGPISRKALGMIKLPKGKSYRELLTEALMEKYGIEK